MQCVTASTLVAIHREPEADWELGTLAKHVGMSRTAFATRFRECVGESPHLYVVPQTGSDHAEATACLIRVFVERGKRLPSSGDA